MFHRLKLDVPHTFAVEQGYIMSRDALKFRDSKNCFVDTWRCPVTGVAMLRPSYLNRDFGDDFKTLGDFRLGASASAFWRNVEKSADRLSMFSHGVPAGASVNSIELSLSAVTLKAISAAAGLYDDLKWCLESKFTLNIDEAFAIHYMGLTDELLRKNNWFAVQWDNIYIHINQQGRLRVYKYADRNNLATEPELWHEADIADPGDFLQKHGRFVFQPIPGYGLLLYHLEKTQKNTWYASNNSAYSVRGAHLIPWTKRRVGSHDRLFETSVVRIALNPYFQNIIGFQKVTFPNSGTYLEEVFDPPYRPTLAPYDVSASTQPTFSANFATVSATLRKSDDSADWAAGVDRQGRIKFALATSDERYTPFVYQWGVRWLPVTVTRNTTPVTITTGYNDVLQRIEITDDSEGNVEGTAELKLQSAAAIAIAQRGDCTWQYEYSANGTDWTIYAGGIAAFESEGLKMEYHPDWGFFWRARVSLHGMEERFDEMFMQLGTAFDGFTLAECINLVLTTYGFAAIAEADMPSVAVTKRVPPVPEGDGTKFRFAPRGGRKGKKILRDLMVLIRAQWIECKMLYDWTNSVWTVQQRERNPSAAWTLTYDTVAENLAGSVAFYTSVEWNPHPPEGNLLQVTGVKGGIGVADKSKLTKSSPLPAPDAPNPSVTDTSSVDYLGRIKAIEVIAPEVDDVNYLNTLARVIAPRVMHRNISATVMLPKGHSPNNIPPDKAITLILPALVSGGGTRTFNMWVKKRTYIVDAADHGPVAGDANEQTILHIDEIWENEFRGE